MMAAVPPWVVLSFCAAIFFIGLMGLLVRRNLLVILMSLELMLNGVNLTFVTFARHLQDTAGQMAVFFIIVVAAVESAIGLSLVIALFRTTRTVDTDAMRLLKD